MVDRIVGDGILVDRIVRLSALSVIVVLSIGVELNAAQRVIKRRLVAWYGRNCRVNRTAQE
jgi:hypothetical protein